MPTETRGLTVWQPWASLLGTPIRTTAKGRLVFAKKYETRSWATDYRGPIAIHAAALTARECLRKIPDYKTLREICTALIPILYRGQAPKGFTWQDVAADLEHELAGLPRRAIICVGELKACHLITEELIARMPARELALGNWTPGGYAWEIVKRRPCPPVTINGAQGLWRWR
jgi:hypothetical protein